MPNDDTEITRLSILHQVYLLLLGGDLTTAPSPRRLRRVLDVGTGPGDWAIAMGEKYTSSEVIATDISVFQPTDVPPNVRKNGRSRNLSISFTFAICRVRSLIGMRYIGRHSNTSSQVVILRS